MSSATPLVVLPGLDGTDVFLRPFAAALPDSITPRIVSYPTHGPQDYQTLLSIVDEATRRLPSFHVLGWSFGGPLALMLAARHAERIRGVVLVSSFVRAPHPLLAPLGPAIRGPVMWTYRFARRAPLWLRSRSDPWRAAKAETWNRIPAAVIAARLRAVAALDARSTLSACRAPLLCLCPKRTAWSRRATRANSGSCTRRRNWRRCRGDTSRSTRTPTWRRALSLGSSRRERISQRSSGVGRRVRRGSRCKTSAAGRPWPAPSPRQRLRGGGSSSTQCR
jgi:pimeloyl-ACP methyl ester carboxylesterase